MKKIITTLTIALGLIGLTMAPVYAQGSKQAVCEGIGLAGNASGCEGTDANNQRVNTTIGNVVNLLSIIVAIIAVIMIIIGGAKYVTSSGDANNINGAKNTIMYALIGLIVVAFAQVMVRFVLNRVTQT